MHERQDADKDSSSSQEQRRRAASAPESGAAAHLLHLQRTLGNAAVARMVGGSQDEADVQRSAVHGVLSSSGQPLGAPVREEMESRMNADFSDVRVHTGGTAQRSAAEIGARAYTSGNHVVLGSGASDKHTLAHELTHVLQQRSGPVAGTDHGDGLKVSDPSDRFERAAEDNARRVMRRSSDQLSESGEESSRLAGDVVQRQPTTRSEANPPAKIVTEQITSSSMRTNEFVRWVHEKYAGQERPKGGSSNFAVLDFIDESGKRDFKPAFNMGNNCFHSEETIINVFAAEAGKYTPLQIFTDRIPCSECEKMIKSSLAGKLTGASAEIVVYYLVDSKQVRNPQERASIISDWWK